MSNKISKIVIVGGGTAGWLSAVFLNRLLKPSSSSPCEITLIESSDIGTVGVGEATIPTIKRTFQLCGIDEHEWMIACNASFKMAIKFTNWRRPAEVFWHPFGDVPSAGVFPLSFAWLKRRLQGSAGPFTSSCYAAPGLCDARKAPRCGDEAPYAGKVEYAYHLDAGLLASYLKGVGRQRGVAHLVDNVLEIGRDDARGFITYVRTEQHGQVSGDLFIDCSGFSGLLINKCLNEPFISFSDSLLCDRAIAMPLPTDDQANDINPFTSATALSAGWVWHTPLFGRSGNGYVYSSACLSDELAEAEFRNHLGPDARNVECRRLKMRVGRTRNAWVKNCVAIGLSGGFIEPLESTGIWFIELALYNLLLNFPDRECHPSIASKFNEIMAVYYEHVREFVMLHYCTTHREDTPFWRDNRYNPHIPDALKDKLELWRELPPGHERIDPPRLFRELSYTCILDGMGHLPHKWPPLLDHVDEGMADVGFRYVTEETERLKSLLAGHYAYLEKLHGVPEQGSAGRVVGCS